MIKFSPQKVNHELQLCGSLCFLSEPPCNFFLKSNTENHRENTEFHRGFREIFFYLIHHTGRLVFN